MSIPHKRLLILLTFGFSLYLLTILFLQSTVTRNSSTTNVNSIQQQQQHQQQQGPFPNNIIYTYFDNIGIGEAGLLESWKESWARNGWTPIVLDRNTCVKHAFYPLLYERFASMPTVNRKEYEMSCYLRWIAMAVVGGGFLSDYDTLNIDFHPPNNIGPEFTIYQGTTPALASASRAEYERILNELALFKPDPKVNTFNGQPHVSDMRMFVKLKQEGKIETTYNLTKGEPKLAHISNDALNRYKKQFKTEKLDKKEVAQRLLKMNIQEAKELVKLVN